MSKKPKIVSAGGVVLRQHTSGLQVLLIHRDRYDDWSLPKGKRETDELLPETAVREIREETGVASRLDLRLPSVRYKVSKGPKAVHYWRSEVVSQRPRRPDDEVSAVKWLPVEAALEKLTYPDERAVIEAAGKGGFEDGERLRLAAKAFAHTAAYDAAVAEWISEGECAGGVFTRRSTLRYGENPHQAAAVYTDGTGGLAQAEQLGGKEMSYNNYQDVDAALRAAYDHAGPAVAVVKHANPCGLAVGEDVADAYRRAHACDPVSAYGGVIAANREVSADMAEAVAGVFTEAIAAPGFAPEALDILSRKKNLRILRVGELDPTRDVRPISGGILLQDRDLIDAPGDDPASWTLVSGDPADGLALRDLEFAWRAVRAVKSNAILLARDGASVGIGMGQVNRVDSCRLAVTRAGDRAAGAVAASDAYFPFADGFEVLARAGVRAVVQPGGSIRDEEVISSARASSVTMYLTGTRHFAH